jgi:hypothetical protein
VKSTTRLTRAGLTLYFRHYRKLVLFSMWLADRAASSPRAERFLAVLDATLLSPFYGARQLTHGDAQRMLEEAASITRAPCICGNVRGRAARGACYYLDWAGDVYARHGPAAATLVEASEAVLLIGPGVERWLMTVRGRSCCAFFPSDYVVCACDKAVCLPFAYARRFPRMSLIRDASSREQPRPARDHLRAILIGLPLLLLLLVGYRLDRSRPRRADVAQKPRF